MTDEKTTTDGNTEESESGSDGLTTLFSSDNTELTDFTEKVKRAILGDENESIQPITDRSQHKKTNRKPTLVTSARNNVVNLFGPK